MPWDLLLSAHVIEPPLFATRDAGERVAAVEERHGLVVLALAVLDDKTVPAIEGINGQRNASAGQSRIAKQPGKAVLPERSLAEQLITKVDHI